MKNFLALLIMTIITASGGFAAGSDWSDDASGSESEISSIVLIGN